MSSPPEAAVRSAARVAALTATLTANRGLLLPLPLRARLLVEATLAELGIEAGPLHLSLETAQGSLEAFVFLDLDFQEDHPWGLRKFAKKLLKIGRTP